MLDALATAALSVADRIHRRIATTAPAPRHVEAVDGRNVGYDIVRDDRHPSGSVALVIGLHGFGADEQQLRTLVPLADVTAPILYITVRGSWTVNGGGHAWFPISEAATGEFDIKRADLEVATDELHSFIETAQRWTDVDNDRCWLIGYSQGAPLALHATITRPDLIAGCAAGAGTLIDPVPADIDLTDIHVMVAGSTIDPFVPVEQTRELRQQLENAGATVSVCPDSAPHVITTTQATAISEWLNRHITKTATTPTEPRTTP